MGGVTKGVDINLGIFDIVSIETAQPIGDAIGAWPRGILGCENVNAINMAPARV